MHILTSVLILIALYCSSITQKGSAYRTLLRHRRQYIPEYDCGVSGKPNTETSIHNETKTRLGEFPWLAALYFRSLSNKWEQRCAGTLITPHIVLTAANCVVRDHVALAREDIKVGLAKYNADYYKEEEHSIMANVTEVVVSPNYHGPVTNYALDIGLLNLTTSVQVSDYIMPACVDWTSTLKPNQENVGYVAVWGRTENEHFIEPVTSVYLSFMNYTSCLRELEQKYRRFLTHDKFCASSSNGSRVTKGHGGSGLTVVRNGKNYVLGVVSTSMRLPTGPDITDHQQSPLLFLMFTDLTNREHHAWLEDQRIRLDHMHSKI